MRGSITLTLTRSPNKVFLAKIKKSVAEHRLSELLLAHREILVVYAVGILYSIGDH